MLSINMVCLTVATPSMIGKITKVIARGVRLGVSKGIDGSRRATPEMAVRPFQGWPA
jgi:hypothetical protein